MSRGLGVTLLFEQVFFLNGNMCVTPFCMIPITSISSSQAIAAPMVLVCLSTCDKLSYELDQLLLPPCQIIKDAPGDFLWHLLSIIPISHFFF